MSCLESANTGLASPRGTQPLRSGIGAEYPRFASILRLMEYGARAQSKRYYDFLLLYADYP
jgi:hypothetical protein